MATNNETKSLMDSIITAHGGLTPFTTLHQIQCTFAFHGLALELKGYGGKTRHPTITVFPQNQNPLDPCNPWTITTALGDGDPTDRWLFTPSKVWIENAEGKVLQERENPRESFQGHVLTTQWDDLQLCYFLSYAMYNYLTMPWLFTRPGFGVEEVQDSSSPHVESPHHRQPWRLLRVTHPPDFPTHTRVQDFYFGEKDFLLKSFDYEVDIFGGVAAHYVFDYKRVGGLGVLLPSVRRVVRRVKGTREAVVGSHTAFWVQYMEVRLVDGEGRVCGDLERVVTE
ncbi:hypothetical protein M409DRAFT_28271 [Zasmidium cellare ATCC 36951]|uniref:Uncharacterized protein n=1 Tax=Zasmidium cellare ATCC 36951 TaxID=1080233 RepID=A0A6A6C5S8_ZASCE|nr:uncharacterized protein M409DRAFT_28271 [Zasmidium cellare ATCC 36951]KAF2161232.1 hypothetical protein M409DRAFT_28271 [Zasmidium cellare ATCC 36951]